MELALIPTEYKHSLSIMCTDERHGKYVNLKSYTFLIHSSFLKGTSYNINKNKIIAAKI